METDNDLINSKLVTPQPQQTQTNAIQQSVDESQPQTLTQVRSSKRWVIPGLIILVILSLSLTGYFAYQNFQIKKEQPNLAQITPTPTTETPSPTTDPTINWKTYNNDLYKFSFKYPSRWSEIPPTGEAYPEGYILIGGKTKEDLLHLSVIPYVGSADNLTTKYQQNPSLFSSTNWGELGKEKEQKTIGNWDIVWFENDVTALASGKEITFKVTNILFTNGKLGFLIHTQDNNKTELNQILSTFKFLGQTNTPIPTTVTNAKKINYSVPTSWTTTTDSSNTFQLSYDAVKLKTCYPDQKGISLCAQYGSYFSATILPYDGGSRHQFIYKNGLGTPKKDELLSDYYEQEYNFDGKSCLFLNGINISQYPTVWGMCVVDNTRAVLFTSHDPVESAYEAILKTFKII